MYTIHRARKIMQLRARLATLLQLALESAQYMIERQPTFPGRPDSAPTHPPRPCGCMGSLLAAVFTAPGANENVVPPLACGSLPPPGLERKAKEGDNNWFWCWECCCCCCCWGWCWCRSAHAATWASCSEKRQTTRAATLWWMIVLLSSPTMSMPNS